MGKDVPRTLIAQLLYKNSVTRTMYRWSGSLATFGAAGALTVVWLFDVQLSDYLKYAPVFKRRFGDKEDH